MAWSPLQQSSPADTTPPLRAAPRLLSPRAAPRRGLFLSISFAVAAIMAVFAVVIVDSRADARRAAEAAEVNLSTALARAIEGAIRGGTDLAARYGGEESILLLPGLDGAAAFAVAEAVRGAVARLALPHDRAPAGIVTVSTGLASVGPGTPPELRALVEGADAELYRSKRDGRNRSSGGARLLERYPQPEALSA